MSTLKTLLAGLSAEQHQIGQQIATRFGDSQPRGGTIACIKPKGGIDSYARGCVHNSIWQFAEHMARAKKYGYWNRPMPFPTHLPSQFAYMEKNKGKTITFGTVSDPFQCMERRYRSTERILRAAHAIGVKLQIETMSDLCAHDDYIGLLQGHTVVMNMGGGLSEEQERIDSPGAPSLKRRRIAVTRLQHFGVHVMIREKGKLRSVRACDQVTHVEGGTPRTFADFVGPTDAPTKAPEQRTQTATVESNVVYMRDWRNKRSA